MNILFSPSDNYRYSGAFLSMVKMASILQNQYGHNVIVILPRKGTGKELLDDSGIKNVHILSYCWTVPLSEQNNPLTVTKQIIGRLINICSIIRIERIIKRENIDIVHINTSWTYVSAVAALRTGTPLVWHVREFLEEGQRMCIWPKNSGYRLMRKADRIIVISNALYKKYCEILKPAKIVKIANGIDPQSFLCTDHLCFKQAFLRFLIVGRICRQKGQADVIRACILLLKKNYTNFELIVAGDDRSPFAEELKNLVCSENAEAYIKFAGPIDNPEEYYKEADVAFMCSISEAFGRVTVEAMMAGALVIGARSAGTLDIISDGETGLLYSSGDIEDLVKKIEYCIAHPAEAREIAKQGQSAAMREFTADRNAKQVNELYKDLIETE